MISQQLTKDPRLISFNALRKAVGWLGILFPAVLITGSYLYGNCSIIQDRISHYYYTITGNLLTGVLCSEALFFITLACISLFLFTKSSDPETKQKKIRNKIYKVCGITIFLAIALIAVYSFSDSTFQRFDKYKPEFWLEWIVLFAFGTSWLVKGELILEDK